MIFPAGCESQPVVLWWWSWLDEIIIKAPAFLLTRDHIYETIWVLISCIFHLCQLYFPRERERSSLLLLLWFRILAPPTPLAEYRACLISSTSPSTSQVAAGRDCRKMHFLTWKLEQRGKIGFKGEQPQNEKKWRRLKKTFRTMLFSPQMLLENTYFCDNFCLNFLRYCCAGVGGELSEGWQLWWGQLDRLLPPLR